MGDDALEATNGWDNIEDADVLREPGALVIGTAEDNEEASAECELSTQVPVAAPEPHQPSREEVESHNATHINSRSWCPHCLMGRRPAAQHRSQSKAQRSVPLYCADYAQARDALDEEYAQLLVGRLYPPRARHRVMFGTVVDSKGGDDEAAIKRLSSFFKESGVHKLV